MGKISTKTIWTIGGMCLLSSSAIPTSLMVTSCSNNSSRTYHFDDIDAIRKFSEKSAVITTSKSFDDGFEAANFLTLNVDFDFLGIMLAREYISWVATEEYTFPVFNLNITIYKSKNVLDRYGVGWNIHAQCLLYVEKDWMPVTIDSISYLKAFYVHNEGEPKPGDFETGIWFNLAPCWYSSEENDDNMPVLNITFGPGTNDQQFMVLPSSYLALDIPKDFIPNITLNYTNPKPDQV